MLLELKQARRLLKLEHGQSVSMGTVKAGFWGRPKSIGPLEVSVMRYNDHYELCINGESIGLQPTAATAVVDALELIAEGKGV